MLGKEKCIEVFEDCELRAKENLIEAEKAFMGNYLQVTEALPPGTI
jgi:hypothetical protein